MASPRRIEKVNALLREEIARTLAEDFQSPPGALVTVTRVASSDDLYYAHVFISIFAADKTEEEKIFRELERRTGSVQHAVNRRLRMRPVPKIKFFIDENEKRRERVEKLLSSGSPAIESTDIS